MFPSRSPASTSNLRAVFVDTISAETTATVLASTVAQDLSDYAPAAASLFNNMKLPAAVVTAGMISLGFATRFPELPRETPENKHIFTPEIRKRCEDLERLHVVVALIAVTSELIVVMWAAVEVNQLTEKQYALAASVWDLIQRDCDLAWSAVNSHFVLGIIGFVAMLTLRAYVMLLSAEASKELMTAASTGTGAALSLMISVVNRGVESGGGNGERYGSTILDLFQHYAVLLAQNAVDTVSPGPLQLSAIVLEIISLVFMANVLLFQNGKAVHLESLTSTEPGSDDASASHSEEIECPVIDLLEIDSNPGANTNKDPSTTGENMLVVVERNTRETPNLTNGDQGNDPQVARMTTKEERKKIANCLALEEEKNAKQQIEEERKAEADDEGRRRQDDSDTSVTTVA